MDFQNVNEVFSVYGVYPNEGKLDGYAIGRFMVEDGKLRILEDHTGMLKRHLTNGLVSANTSQLKALTNSAYIRVVAESKVVEGKKIPVPDTANPIGPHPKPPPTNIEAPSPSPDMGQQMVLDPEPSFAMQTPPPVFDYIRVGMREPQVLEVKGNDVYMNGELLSKPEVARILETIHNGIGKLKYRKVS